MTRTKKVGRAAAAPGAQVPKVLHATKYIGQTGRVNLIPGLTRSLTPKSDPAGWSLLEEPAFYGPRRVTSKRSP